MKRISLILIIALLTLNLIQGQNIVNINTISSKPQIDGILSNNEWAGVDSITNFTQLEPIKGDAASEKTIVYLAYDNENIYFAIKCFQENSIIANVQTRDQLLKSDDVIAIILDTYNDNRSGYGFMINPIGTQTDLRINDDGRIQNYNRDIEWSSAAKIFSWGWSVEIAIPFKNIKFDPSITTWGLNIGRVIRANSETCWWTDDITADLRISQNGRMIGIITPEISGQLLVTPYTTLSYSDDDAKGSDNIKADAGADIRFNINSNFNINATFNPDFASIEGDKQTIDLSGYEISYPEKRLFFQEGNEMFNMRYRLFYSRRIGDINYGGKFTGKAGDYSINVLNVRSVENSDRNEAAAFYSVARVKKDIFKSSSIGFIFADKSTDTTGVRSFGLDWTLNPGKNWKITGQLMGSSPGKLLDHSGGFIRVAHESNKHHIHIRYSNIGKSLKDNIDEMGFISDDDRKELDADLTYRFWFKNKEVKYIDLKNMNNLYWGQDGSFRSSKFRNSFRIYFNNNFSLDLYHVAQNRQVDASYFDDISSGARYNNYYLKTTLGYSTDESSFASIKYSFGKNFGRDMKIYEGHTSLMLFKKVVINYSIVKLEFTPTEIPGLNLRLENPSLLNILSMDYYFTNNLWIHIFAQSDSFNERFYFYGKFGWRFKPPFGSLYVIYAGDDYYDHEDLIQMQSNTVFLKLTYPIGI